MLDEFRVSVEIEGDIHSIWNRLVNWKSQGDWMAMTKVWSSADDSGISGVGTVVEAFTGIGRIGILDQMKVTDWNPPYFCAVDHYGKFIKGLGEFRLIEIAPGRIRFDWYEKIDAPKPILLLVKPGILIAVTYSLRKFARSFPT